MKYNAQILLSIIFALIFSRTAFAIDIDRSYDVEVKPEFVLTSGIMLPFGIVGVRDKYAMNGLYYSGEAETAPKYEIGLFAANAKEVTFYTLSLAYKIDVDFYGALNMFLNFGVDAHYYKRKPTATTEFDFVSSGGGHFGFGTYHEIGEGLYLRSDFKMNFGPGQSLYAGLGLAWRFEPSLEEENPEQ